VSAVPDLCHTLAVCLSAEDRGKVTLQWLIPAGDADGIIAEFRGRFGEPVLESTTDAAVVDEMTRRMNESSGHVIISPQE
jgi:hypothetical protein